MTTIENSTKNKWRRGNKPPPFKKRREEMQIRMIGHTVSAMSTGEIEGDFRAFGGANAGICYMKDKYKGEREDRASSIDRFKRVIETGHHSVAEHVQVTLLLEDIPKIVAMMLNNMGVYATSEKSGRYTEMRGNTEKERKLYDKWVELFKGQINMEYGDKLDECRRDKLARENARYLLSVFTPTTMSYTASLRTWNYIIDWFENLDMRGYKQGYFKEKLATSVTEVVGGLRRVAGLYVAGLRDIKRRPRVLIENERIEGTNGVNVVGGMYESKYYVSFAGFGQLQRHRTLQHIMSFDGESTRYYVPKIIEGTELEKEWFADMASVKETVPQGTMVYVKEYGGISDFILKCMERLCGRAQLEVMLNTESTLKGIQEAGVRGYIGEELGEVYARGRIKKKCEMVGCKEKCEWGSKYSSERLI